jgi:uncharacterized repeat protein (TIGR03803 family)
MKRNGSLWSLIVVAMVLVGNLASVPDSQAAAKEKVLYNFHPGKYGSKPFSGVVMDQAGNLYGTAYMSGGLRIGCGVVYELPRGGSYTSLHDFAGGTDGCHPVGDLIIDEKGSLYGTTVRGGNTSKCVPDGCGVVFQLTPNTDGTWTESALYSFAAGDDGYFPYAGLALDSNGNLYGTSQGGALQGTVFRLTPGSNGQWTHAVLYSFSGTHGTLPLFSTSSSLILDTAGNVYGTTFGGGDLSACGGSGCGVVFELTPTSAGEWSETVLYRFRGGRDGANPSGGVVFDSSGSLWGTTSYGGNPSLCPGTGGCGVVFELTPTGGQWKESVLHRFTDGKDGGFPSGSLVVSPVGNLYGTTVAGGTLGDCQNSFSVGCGVVFELSPTTGGKWKEQVIYTQARRGTAYSYAGLILDSAGNLYGTASGACCGGAVFEIVP